jgi:hypothetical protein
MLAWRLTGRIAADLLLQPVQGQREALGRWGVIISQTELVDAVASVGCKTAARLGVPRTEDRSKAAGVIHLRRSHQSIQTEPEDVRPVMFVVHFLFRSICFRSNDFVAGQLERSLPFIMILPFVTQKERSPSTILHRLGPERAGRRR